MSTTRPEIAQVMTTTHDQWVDVIHSCGKDLTTRRSDLTLTASRIQRNQTVLLINAGCVPAIVGH
jgi:hypothetical protein